MKKYFYILLAIFFISSCKKTGLECKFSGIKTEKTFLLTDFDTIEVNPLIRLTIKDTNKNIMKLKADKDVIENVVYSIKNKKLIVSNNTYCTIENNSAVADIFLQVDEISCIIANTDKEIVSDNTLKYNNLELICENNNIGKNNIADFNLDIQNNNLKIEANGSSIFNIKGSTKNLFVGFYGVNPVFNGQNFIADTIKVFHRGSNNMYLNPIHKISGNLFGYGDIYLYNHPQVLNINIYGRGHIYFVN